MKALVAAAAFAADLEIQARRHSVVGLHAVAALVAITGMQATPAAAAVQAFSWKGTAWASLFLRPGPPTSYTTFTNGLVARCRRDLRDAGFAGPAHGSDQRGERVVRARPPYQASHHGVAGGE